MRHRTVRHSPYLLGALLCWPACTSDVTGGRDGVVASGSGSAAGAAGTQSGGSGGAAGSGGTRSGGTAGRDATASTGGGNEGDGSGGASESGGVGGAAVTSGGAGGEGATSDAGRDSSTPDADSGTEAGACEPLPVLDAGFPCSVELCSTSSGIEVRLTTTEAGGWYVGALLTFWIDVCGVRFGSREYRGGDHRTLAYLMTREDFDALDRDAPVYVYIGDPDAQDLVAVSCGNLDSVLAQPTPVEPCSN